MEEEKKETEWWWIDYLENELDPSLEKDLQMLLEHSQEDRDSFENFRLLKQWLRDSDPVGAWPVQTRLDRMRRSVMAVIETLPERAQLVAESESAPQRRLSANALST